MVLASSSFVDISARRTYDPKDSTLLEAAHSSILNIQIHSRHIFLCLGESKTFVTKDLTFNKGYGEYSLCRTQLIHYSDSQYVFDFIVMAQINTVQTEVKDCLSLWV